MKNSSWSKENKEWILKTDQLFSDLFAGNFLTYKYHKFFNRHGLIVVKCGTIQA